MDGVAGVIARHGIVYAEDGVYAGWPANHGAWQWGDEFLVGFLRGKFKHKSMHNIAEPFEKMLARSLDGGDTWSVEKPNEDFDCPTVFETAPPFGLSQSIIRVCGVYDHGGDECDERGGFYLSHDRGHEWSGPYGFNGIEMDEGLINTSRTRTLRNLVFLSSAQASLWGTDRTFCARHDGEQFNFVADVLNDDARAVMPAVAEFGSRVVCVMRRRSGRREGWIDAVHSDDDGATWSTPCQVGVTGKHNGNPPALIALPDGRLLAAFGNRDEGCLMGALSSDGVDWSTFVIRASESDRIDIGYPQLFMRSDGVPVCVYYWASRERPHQHIASTKVAL